MEAEKMSRVKICLSVLFVGVVALILHFYNVLVVRPRRLRLKLRNQGIRGPSPSFLVGNIPEMKRIINNTQELADKTVAKDTQNQKDGPAAAVISHDWPSTIFPHLRKWRTDYGPVFVYSTGSIQLLCITDVELAKEISLCTSLSLGKPSYLSEDRRPLLGRGILSSSGPLWAHQRKIIAPEFFPDKGMVKLMVDATTSTLKSWESRTGNEGAAGSTIDIRIDEDLRSLSADIISRACFGSSYAKGEEIFSKLRTLQQTMSRGSIGIPGFRYLPVKNNRDIWKLEKEIDSLILEVVNQRIDEGPYEKDLLQMVLEGAQSFGAFNRFSSSNNMISRDRFIVDNCKNIYFAGHETTAITASWSLLLLAAYPEWQDRARAEVLEVCKDGLPADADLLRSMKVLTMVIQETLRLYPPAVFVIRRALQDIEFKGIVVPKGMDIQIPIPALQQSTHLWGADAHEFNPERFADGILGACKIPQGYMPFGVGPRVCVGQHFAMTELKVILSLILSKFSFSLSPAYRHSPAFRLVVQPGDGVRLTLRRL